MTVQTITDKEITVINPSAGGTIDINFQSDANVGVTYLETSNSFYTNEGATHQDINMFSSPMPLRIKVRNTIQSILILCKATGNGNITISVSSSTVKFQTSQGQVSAFAFQFKAGTTTTQTFRIVVK